MANIRVTCPACKSELEIDQSFDGQEVECGNCLEVFTAKKPGGAGRSGTGKIPGAGKSPAGTSGTGSSKSKSADKPARKKRRDEDDDDDYEHDRRRRDDDDDDDYYDRPRGSPPPNYLVQSILVTLLCCWIFGIIAIIYAAQVESKWAKGDVRGAREASAAARMWCWLSFGSVAVIFVLAMGLAFVGAIGGR
jgi:predicted Zn finger-like uncharacterized protein